MGLTIKRKEDKRVVHACTHNLADIPNGVTVKSAELVSGSILKEGTAIGKGSDGLYHVEKTALVVEAVAASGTSVKIAKGSHFKVGDFVMSAVNGKAYAINHRHSHWRNSKERYYYACRRRTRQQRRSVQVCT